MFVCMCVCKYDSSESVQCKYYIYKTSQVIKFNNAFKNKIVNKIL